MKNECCFLLPVLKAFKQEISRNDKRSHICNHVDQNMAKNDFSMIMSKRNVSFVTIKRARINLITTGIDSMTVPTFDSYSYKLQKTIKI